MSPALTPPAALHEAAHIVAMRVFAEVGVRVGTELLCLQGGAIEPGADLGRGRSAICWTEASRDLTSEEMIGSLVAGLIVSDITEEVAPGWVKSHSDWRAIEKYTGLSPEELRGSPLWKGMILWVKDHWKEIREVANALLEGEREFPLDWEPRREG